MKDYCINDFQRKSFILNFSIEPNNIIKVYYADGTVDEKQFDLKTIKWILAQMRKQIINFEPGYKKNKGLIAKYKKLINVNRFFSIVYMLLIILLLSSFSIISIPPMLLDAYLIFSSIRSNKVYKNILKKIEIINADYEKNLFFVEHSEEFKNAAISYEGLKHSSLSIEYALHSALRLNKQLSGEKHSDSCMSSILGFQNAEENVTAIEDLKQMGYKEIADIKYPIFNEGSIDRISKPELETFQVHNKNGKGPVLVKTMHIK